MKAFARRLSFQNPSQTSLNKEESPAPPIIREASYISVADPVVTDDTEPHAPESSSPSASVELDRDIQTGKDTVDDGATLVPTDSAESGKHSKPRGRGFERLIALVHSPSKSPAPVQGEKVKDPVDSAVEAITITGTSEDAVATEKVGDQASSSNEVLDSTAAIDDQPPAKEEKPKVNPFKRLRLTSLVPKGANKGHKTAAPPVEPPTPNVALRDDALEDPNALVRSITPSQFGELVDISMAAEASLDAQPNAPPSPTILPSIEAVLAASPVLSASNTLAPESPSENPAPVIPVSIDVLDKKPIDETTPVPDLPPSAETLATEIHTLIAKIPRPAIVPSPPNCPEPKAPKKDGEGKPIPPSEEARRGFPLPANLASCLKDRDVMTGEAQISRGDSGADVEATSVWSILDALRAPWADDKDDDVEKKLMLYVPLDFSDGSKVEVARAVEVQIGVATTETESAGQWGGGYIPQGVWPFEGWWGSKKKPVEAELPKVEAPGSKKPTKKVLLPSPDKLSVELTWWGYRLHLPPPVVDKFSESAEQASKQGALVTTALQFLVTHIPVDIVPLPLRPVVALLATLIPYIGYIGAFLVWSASQLKSFDQGLGISLTATWLLPVALIPSAIKPPAEVQTPAETPSEEPGSSEPPTSDAPSDETPPTSDVPSSSPAPEDPSSTPSPDEPSTKPDSDAPTSSTSTAV